MKNSSSKTQTKARPVSNGKSKTQQQASSYFVQESKLRKLFEDSLKDIYWAEKALCTALPKMAAKATSAELVKAIEKHLEETKGHVQKVEEVFGIFDKKAVAKKCDAMDGLIKEAKGIMEETDKGAMRDAGIIAASQKVEHYEIATYGTLRTYAEILGVQEAADILQGILDEERQADDALTGIASSINIEASEEEED